jgi:hypothetical protein
MYVAYLLKARIVELAEMAVAREWLCKQMLVAKQWLGDCHVITATVAHTTIAEPFEAVFFCMAMPRLYNLDTVALKSSCLL